MELSRRGSHANLRTRSRLLTKSSHPKDKTRDRSVNGIGGARDKVAEDPPDDETQAERIHRILAEREGMHPVDRVSGILDHLDFDVDEYIEEIRGR